LFLNAYYMFHSSNPFQKRTLNLLSNSTQDSNLPTNSKFIASIFLTQPDTRPAARMMNDTYIQKHTIICMYKMVKPVMGSRVFSLDSAHVSSNIL